MDKLDLLEIRKKLHSYKKTGQSVVLNLLQQLDTSSLDQDQINISKIHKTVRSLAKLDKSEADSLFSEADIEAIRNKANAVYQKMKNAPEPDRKQSVASLNSELSDKKDPIQYQSIDDLLRQVNIPDNFDPQRLRIIQRLLHVCLNKKQELILIKRMNDIDFATLVKKLESEAFLKYQQKPQYQTTIKQMLKYFTLDLDGSVRSRFASGMVSAPEAILLKTENWTCDQKLKEARQIGSEQVKASDLGHFKRIAQEINKDTPLNLCNSCGEKQLKLVNEIQTRASDEPSSKFWECLNCGMAETTNG